MSPSAPSAVAPSQAIGSAGLLASGMFWLRLEDTHPTAVPRLWHRQHCPALASEPMSGPWQTWVLPPPWKNLPSSLGHLVFPPQAPYVYIWDGTN